MSKIQSLHLNQTQKAIVKKPEKVQKTPVKTSQMLDSPETMQPDDIRAAQQELGNQVVQRALDKNTHRQSLTDDQGNLRQDIAEQIQRKRGGGSQLPEKVQQEAAQKLGHKFTDVRIHTDGSADKLSRAIHARAFTIGKDIFFKSGVFAPSSTAGRETIIHELTHVIQQDGKGSTQGALKLGARGTAHEKEADQMGKRYAPAISAGAARGGALQTQEDEDELQMQAEEEELQMQEDEEELQMQEDEEELQMQPDTVGTIQRGDDEDKNIPKPPPMTPKMQMKALLNEAGKAYPGPKKDPTTGNTLKSALSGGKNAGKSKASPVSPVNLEDQLKSKAKSMKSGKGIEALEKTRAEKFKQMQSFSDEPTKEGKLARVPSAAEKRVSSREKLMATISNASSKPEDVKAAQEKLNLLHKRGKWDTFKSFFKKGGSTKSYAEQAGETRKQNLMKAAQGGDEEAYKKYKEEEEERGKNSTSSKIKGALGGLVGKVGGLISGPVGGAVKGMAKDKLTEYKGHFMGGSTKPEEKEDKEKSAKSDKEESAPSTSSGGGSGVGAIMEKYADLVRENMTLKEKLKQLEAKGT